MRLPVQIKFRVPDELKARAIRLGNRRAKNESEISREAVLAYVESEEKRLELPPITETEVKKVLKELKRK
jgi:predicted DNA-binding protein